ncbi:MAG: sigma-70 family RNA polymerase sigma factor [Planctomycetota bacterium]|nr:MAG: sigma-70 family RNA polymerase sigma factor [Planctomycetota bacterium]
MDDAPEATAPHRPESALVEALRAGDDDAYVQLVRQYGGPMLAVARRLLRNEADAQDALQDAFLSAFKSIRGFQGQSQLSTWLHRIAVNAALMKQRARTRRPEQPIEELLPAFDGSGHRRNSGASWPEDPTRTAEAGELKKLVADSIDRLPETYRTVLLLRDVEGLDGAEAAASLGVNENTVKIRLHRARQALRELLDPHMQGTRACSSPAKS